MALISNIKIKQTDYIASSDLLNFANKRTKRENTPNNKYIARQANRGLHVQKCKSMRSTYKVRNAKVLDLMSEAISPNLIYKTFQKYSTTKYHSATSHPHKLDNPFLGLLSLEPL